MDSDFLPLILYNITLKLDCEVVFCIIKADIFNHFAQHRHIIGEQTVLSVIAEDVAQDSSKVFVPRIGQETAGVCQHSDESTQKSQI